MADPAPKTDAAAAPDEAGRWLGAVASWPAALCAWLERDPAPVVRVLVAQTRGSVPREPGACMLVSATACAGTIGGGRLEWRACEAARALLAAPPGAPAAQVERLVLGAELAQCCGGVVWLWLERFTRADLPLLAAAAGQLAQGLPVLLATDVTASGVGRRLQPTGGVSGVRWTAGEHPRLLEHLDPGTPLWLYGAGHVGQALVRVLAGLPFEVTWFDPRPGMLPLDVPANVRAVCAADPVATVARAPANVRFLVMTHDHGLDYALCRAILRREAPEGPGMDAPSFAWAGLIGSRSKAARFRSRLAREGVSQAVIARLTCPIGLTAIESKLPAAIAVGIAAQLLTGMGAAAEPAPGTGAREVGAACAAPGCAGCQGPGDARS